MVLRRVLKLVLVAILGGILTAVAALPEVLQSPAIARTLASSLDGKPVHDFGKPGDRIAYGTRQPSR